MLKMKSVLLTILLAPTSSLAQTTTTDETCVSITASRRCSAFNPFQISTDSYVTSLYPFLENVKNSSTFDTQLSAYINTTYVQLKYETLFGCGNIVLTNTTDLYARYTASVICNGIIQNSKDRCNATDAESVPLCANSCAEQALSESVIASDPALCSNPSNYTDTQIRADFTNCALPAESLQHGNCVQGSVNEPSNCGYGSSTLGMCKYCSQSSDDTCCTASNATTRCANVAIPSSISSITLPTATSSASSTGSSATATSFVSGAGTNLSNKSISSGLSGTTIAVIIVGCVVGAVLLAGLVLLIIFCCRKRRRRQDTAALGAIHDKKAAESGSDLSSGRRTPPLLPAGDMANYTVLPGGRIARKSTLVQHTVLPGGAVSRKASLLSPPMMTQASEEPNGFSEKSASVSSLREMRAPTPPQQESITNPAVLAAVTKPKRFSQKPASECRIKTSHVPEQDSVPSSSTFAAVTRPNRWSKRAPSDRQIRSHVPADQDPAPEYAILPGGRKVRTAPSFKAPTVAPPSINSPTMAVLAMSNIHSRVHSRQSFKYPTPDQSPEPSPQLDSKFNNNMLFRPRFPQGPTSNSPQERFPDLVQKTPAFPDDSQNTTDNVTHTEETPTEVSRFSVDTIPRDLKPANKPAPSSEGGKSSFFPYPIALLSKVFKAASSSKNDSDSDKTPSLSAADLDDYKILPGGRLARKAPIRQPSALTSPKSSPQVSRAPSPERQSISKISAPFSSPLKPETAITTPQARSTATSEADYEELPGGRMVRKSALPDCTTNPGLKRTFKFKSFMGDFGVGAAAVCSAAKMREIEEKSRKGSVSSEPKTNEPPSTAGATRASQETGSGGKSGDVSLGVSKESSTAGSPPGSSQGLKTAEEAEKETALPLTPPETPLDEMDYPVPLTPAVPTFKDPYSDELFSPGSLVAAVWSYQPQTRDEFALERGDMIEIVNIWNDGWATGRFSADRIDTWEAKHGILIDTFEVDLIDMGSDGTAKPVKRPGLTRRETTTVKAFPLVCVCAPRYWRKAVNEKREE